MLGKKVWSVSPTFFIVTLSMIAMTAASWFWNKKVFYVELLISIVSVIVIFIDIYNFRSYMHSVIKSSLKALGNIDENILEKYSVPVVSIDNNGRMIWFNSNFRENLVEGRDCTSEPIYQFISQEGINNILLGRFENIESNDRFYTVFGTEVDGTIILYFIFSK